MRNLIVPLLLIAFLPLAACVTTGTPAKTNDASMEWRMKSLEESFLNYREEQRRQAEQLNRMQADLDQRFQTMQGKLDSMNDMSDAVVVEGAPKREEAPQDEGWVTDLKPEDDGWQEVKPESSKKMMDKTMKAAPKVAASPEPKPWASVPKPKSAPAPAMTARKMYEKGLTQYKAEKTGEARKTFDAFLSRYPKSSLAANALYWKGETYYSEKNYPQAILTFREVVSRYPKHHKAASAMLKVGMSYEMIGDRDNAVFYLRALVDDYPNSSPASMGRSRLSALGQ